MEVKKVTLLKEVVEKAFGRKILIASDCDSLSKDIYRQTNVKLSLNTLRRFFNLIKSKYQVSLFTLDLLSRYCGFPSFSELADNGEEMQQNSSGNDQGLLNFLTLLFNDSDVKCINDVTYINLIHTTIIYLDKKPNIIDQLQRRIAKTLNGQIFYYEQSVNIDKLDSYYGVGLCYYLNEKRTVEAQIFGNSLLCFRYWLTMNMEAIKKHHNEILCYTINESVPPSIAGRYFAAQLYFAEAFNREIGSILTQAREFYSSIKPSKFIYQDFPAFECILSEALVLTYQYEEALFYIHEAIKKRNNKVAPHVDLRLFESIYLNQAIAFANIGREEKSLDILETITAMNFYFLSRNFNRILYFSLQQTIKKRKSVDEQLQYLVEQTGFKKLLVKSMETIAVVLLVLTNFQAFGYLVT
jgi:tetratricopeptide (TPR) repeat protein